MLHSEIIEVKFKLWLFYNSREIFWYTRFILFHEAIKLSQNIFILKYETKTSTQRARYTKFSTLSAIVRLLFAKIVISCQFICAPSFRAIIKNLVQQIPKKEAGNIKLDLLAWFLLKPLVSWQSEQT